MSAGPPTRASNSRIHIWIAIAVIVVAVVTVIAVLAVLSYHSYSFEILETTGFLTDTGSYNQSFPVGSQVSGSWSTPTGVSVDFYIFTPGGTPVFEGYGYSGSFSFTADYSSYLFDVSSSTLSDVSVSGSYSSL